MPKASYYGLYGLPDGLLEPPENTSPPDWNDWADEIYKIFREEREREEERMMRE